MSALELAVCIALIICGAYLSSTEIALFSLSRFQLRALKEQFRSTHRKVKRLLADPSGVLITILVLNEIVNIGLSALITKTISKNSFLGFESFFITTSVPKWLVTTLLGIIITTPIILFLCEINPKIIGARANRLVAALSATLMSVLYDALKPIRLVLQQIIKIFRVKSANDNDKILKESEFLMIAEEGRREGAIEEDELELIKNVFELDDTNLEELYIPMNRVTSLPATTSVRDAMNVMRTHRYSRVPITGERKSDIVGILYTKDLLHAKFEPQILNEPVIALARKPLFVLPSMRVNSLFRKFKQQRIHMAIIRNESGQALGIVTMSDVLNELFEDLFPETPIESESK